MSCPICNEFPTETTRDRKEICERCSKIYDIINSNDFKHKGLTCQYFRLQGAINGNWRMEKVMQNMHRLFFLEPMIKKGDLVLN